MSIIWFFVAVVFFILWLVKKPQNTGDIDDAFRRGRESIEDDLRFYIDSGKTSPEELRTLLTDASTPVAPIQPSTEAVATAGSRVAISDDTISDDIVSVPRVHPVATPVAKVKKPHNQFGTLNVILYLASFLLVAAAAALIAASMPAGIKLVGLVSVVVLFYGAGMVLYKRVPILKPAAVAFVGTGLAILPFVGFALHSIGNVSANASWVIISLAGLVAYYGAAIVLRSQVVSYLTVGFVLSLACSFVSLVPVGFVWYFVALIASSLVAAVVARFKPGWLPAAFSEPIERTGQLVTPIALLASLLTFSSMTLQMYEIVFASATLHYLVLWIQHRAQWLETVSRVLLHITLFLYAMSLWTTMPVTLGFAWLALLVGQIIYSLAVVNKFEQKSYATEITMIAISLILIPCGIGFWSGADSALLATISWSVFSVLGLVTALRLRSAWWGYVPLLGSLVIPSLVTQSIISPALPLGSVAFFYSVLAAIGLIVMMLRFFRSSLTMKTFIGVSFGVWLAAAITTALLFREPLTVALTLFAASALVLGASYAVRTAVPEIGAGVLFYAAVAALLGYIGIEAEWFALALTVITCLGAYAGAYYHHTKHQVVRRNYLVMLAVAFGITALGSFTSGATVAAHLAYGVFGLTAIGALLARARTARTTVTPTLITAYASYTALFWIAGMMLGGWWLVLAYGVAAALLSVASHIERQAWILIGGLLAVVGAVMAFLTAVSAPAEWTVLLTTWGSALVFMALYEHYVTHGDRTRTWITIGAVWTVGAIGALSGLSSFDDSYRYGAAITLLLTGASGVLHGYIIRRRVIAETGLYVATLGLQWVALIAALDLSLVVFAYWWAATIGIAGLAFKNYYHERLLISLSLITLVTAGYALTEGSIYSLIFLAQNVGIAAAGAVTKKQWLAWWGVAGSVASVIYFLRDYLYVWLALLGLFLIGIVVWRLVVSPRERQE